MLKCIGHKRGRKMKVTFVCHGNICRSPMAQFILKSLEPKIETDSKATHTDELGSDMYYPAKVKLTKEGIPFAKHTATLLNASDYDNSDYFLVMDTENFTNTAIRLNGDPQNKVFRLLEFTGENRDVADPWYTGNFDRAYDDILKGCKAFLEYLNKKQTDGK